MICLISSFLLGSIPFGLIVARIFKVNNLRQSGSGNIGASNVSRVVGFWPAGLITFVLDLLKGAVPPLLWMHVESQSMVWAAGLFAVLGHCYSPWIGFRGGKGVATGLGVVLVLSPFSALVGIATFILTFLQYRIASLSSMAGLLTATIACVIFTPLEKHLWVAAALVFLILIRHEVNIDALFQNKEHKFH